MSDDSRFDIDLNTFLAARVTRRRLLQGGVALGALAAFGPLASACGGSDTDSSTSGDTGAGKKGGILRVGIVGGSAKDTADPHMAPYVPDDAINWLMYEGLMQYSPTLTPELLLAEEVSPNADASEWTVRLKSDLVWQDGKPITADDVVYSFQRIVDPKNPLDGASALGGLKPSGITKVDDLTTKFTWDAPNVLFGTDGLTQRLVHVVPQGFDPRKPVGSGPWKLTDFRPGEQFVFEKNTNWHGEEPYLDGVTLIHFADPTARVNALTSGSIEALVELPPSQMNAVKSSGVSPLNAKSGGWVPFCMRIDAKPFDDVRVRQAFRLIVDRQEMLDTAYSGVGWLANDMYSPFDKGYPADIPQRTQDLEQAKSLLKEAGYDNDLTVELVTSDAVGNGAVSQCQVFAEQAKGAGVTVNVKKVDSGVIWGDDYLSWPFSVDFWGYRNYLQQAASGSTPDAPYNETHWQNDEWLALVNEANRTVDDAKRNELVGQAAAIEFEEGGYIIASFKNQLDAYSDKVAGFVTDDVMGIPLGRWRFDKVSFK